MSYVKLFIGLFFIFILSSCTDKNQANDQNNQNNDVIKLTIDGIVCSSCKQTIESKLKNLDGITNAIVFLDKDKNNLEVKVDQAKCSIDDIKKTIDGLGFEVISIEKP